MHWRTNHNQLRALRLVVACLLGAVAAKLAGAAEPTESRRRWHVVETPSLRILNYGTQAVSPGTATACETMRQELARQWLEPEQVPAWRPKCDIVLHTSEAGYLRAVGAGGRSTAASALIDRRGDRVVVRRVDVLATRPDWLTAALPHELTHVVLADRFAVASLPRWLDEGMAILADPAEKRIRHVRGVRRAFAAGSHFRLAELWGLADYPPSGRWGTFYDQSAALVDYLVTLEGQASFLQFVELALASGCEQALQQVYQLDAAQLERQWLRALSQPAGLSMAADSAASSASPPGGES